MKRVRNRLIRELTSFVLIIFLLSWFILYLVLGILFFIPEKIFRIKLTIQKKYIDEKINNIVNSVFDYFDNNGLL